MGDILNGLTQMAEGLDCLNPLKPDTYKALVWVSCSVKCPHCEMLDRLHQLKKEQPHVSGTGQV
jgi:hypothetical protein